MSNQISGKLAIYGWALVTQKLNNNKLVIYALNEIQRSAYEFIRQNQPSKRAWEAY